MTEQGAPIANIAEPTPVVDEKPTDTNTTTSTTPVPPPQQSSSTTEVTPEVEQQILRQVEYYFSPQNLVKDLFLSKEMAKHPETFVSIEVLATFNKLKALSTDVNLIANVLRKSEHLIVSEDGQMVKTKTPHSRKLLDKTFANTEEISAFFQTIFLKYNKGQFLSEDDQKYAEALLEYHPKAALKKGCGVAQIKIGSVPEHEDTLCFFVVRTDGTEEDFSYLKSISNMEPSPKRKNFQKNPERKKQRVERAAPAPFVPQLGCLLKISGVKPDLNFRTLREYFEEKYTNVKFANIEDGVAHIRFSAPEFAQAAVKDDAKTFGDNPTVTLLEGEEEAAYFEKNPIPPPGEKNFGGRGGRGGRGRGRGRGRGGRGGGRGRGPRNDD